MELLQLKYFMTVAHTEHVSKAAERLFISQSSLSKAITRLENELGYQLFDRTPRSIRLNESGRIFLKHVERMFFELDEAQLSLKTLNEDHQRFVSFSTTDPEYVVDMIDAYMKKNADVLFKSHIFSDAQLDEVLALQGVDFAIGEITPTRRQNGWTRLFEDQLYAVCSQNSLLTKEAVLPVSELISRPLSVFPSHTVQRKKMEQMYLLNGIMPHIFYEDSSVHKVMLMMLKIDGVSFVTRSGLGQLLGCVQNSPEIGTRLRLLPIEFQTCQWEVGLCPAGGISKESVAQDFLLFAQEYFQTAFSTVEKTLIDMSVLQP